MHRALTALALLVSLSLPATARAESSFSDRFFYGTSPGQPSSGKLFVVGGFYTLSLASFGVGVASLFQAKGQRDEAEDFKLTQPPGFCNDLASGGCMAYHARVADARGTQAVGLALLGVGGLFAVGGGVTAELWHNEILVTPKVALDDGGRTPLFGLEARF